MTDQTSGGPAPTAAAPLLLPSTPTPVNSSESAKKTQVGGNYYKSCPIQPFDYSLENSLNACQHTAIKYVTRYGQKDPSKWREDLEKAIHTIQYLIEWESKRRGPDGTVA